MALTQKQVALAADWAAEDLRQDLIDEVHTRITESCIHSPLEATFLAWWLAVDNREIPSGDAGWELELLQQHPIVVDGRTYRADFTVFWADVDYGLKAHEAGFDLPKIAVELDGHDYHERTKEQVIERNQRDRALQGAGWQVFHFSGSELVANPRLCVLTVRAVADAALHQIHQAMWRLEFNARRDREAATVHAPLQEQPF